ncbi:MAG: hypothetical protein MJ252_09265 [archaeon]|nr:hypothetical protein [archaeon]
MRYFALIFLFAAVFCNRLAEQNEKSTADIIKCVIEKVGPMSQDVIELIEAVREKDWVKVALMAAKLVEEGRLAFLECFKDGDLGIDWVQFGKCLLDHGAEAMDCLKEIVQAILAKDWDKVKELALNAAIKALPIVIDCFNAAGGDE